MVIFPNFTAEQREKGMTDFNDLAFENGQLAKHQLEEAMWRAGERDDGQTAEIGKGVLRTGWAGKAEVACKILKETRDRFLIKLEEDCVLIGGRQASKGEEVYMSKHAVERVGEQSMEATIIRAGMRRIFRPRSKESYLFGG